MTQAITISVAALTGLAIALTGCEREARVDPATVDAGAYRNPTNTPTPPLAPITLPGGTTIMATPAARAVSDHLASGRAVPQRFALTAIHFNGMTVREDPNGSVASLVAVLNAYPDARVRIEVGRPAVGVDQPIADTGDLARQVAQVFVRNGLDVGRIEAAGVVSGPPVEPLTTMVVTPS